MKTATYPIYTVHFWRAYTIQMRPYLLFVSGIAGIAGMAMATGPRTPMWNIFVSFIPFFLGYGFGQALTDCFQTDTDKLSAPYRPLSKGIISIRSVLLICILGLSASAVLLYLLNPMSFWLSTLAVFGLATYSYIKKNIWFGGPFYNAWIVGLLPVMGYFAVSQTPGNNFPLHLYPCIAITFFSYASFVLIGYLKDIDADKATGYKTFPVVFGWNKTILLGDVFALATLLLFWSQGNKNDYEIICGLAGSVVLITGQLYGHLSKYRNVKEALIPILSTVRSFVLLHMALVLHFQPHWWITMLVYYILFEIALYLRPSRYQV